jgi:hypothetical protein
MKNMGYTKKAGLLLLCALLLAIQGCVRDDLETCPPAVRYAISFEYLLHTVVDESGQPVELFAEDVEKMYIYVFDSATDTCIYADTTLTGPFTDNFIYSLPLSTGMYDIIVWGWGRHTGDPDLNRSTGVIPAVIEPGKRTLSEARFMLNELNSGSSDSINGKIEKTFYGEIPDRSIPPFISRVDTVSLMNLSKMIRVIIPDIEDDPVTFPDWQNNVKVTIEGDNGAYFFGRTAQSGSPAVDPANGHAIYKPFRTFYDDAILSADPVFTTQFEGNHTGLVVDISTLRLVLGDENMKLVIRWKKGTENRWMEIPLLELVMRHPDYAWSGNAYIQRDLDRHDRWEVIFRITDSYLTVSTNIMQWHVIKQDVVIGGLLQ